MGLLGGDYDRESGVMFIRKCVPLREEEQGEQSVAADASHHLAVIEALKEEGMQCLGWYHSHPQFENVPSNTDCHQVPYSLYCMLTPRLDLRHVTGFAFNTKVTVNTRTLLSKICCNFKSSTHLFSSKWNNSVIQLTG